MLKFVAVEFYYSILDKSFDKVVRSQDEPPNIIVELLSVNKQTYHSNLSAPKYETVQDYNEFLLLFAGRYSLKLFSNVSF